MINYRYVDMLHMAAYLLAMMDWQGDSAHLHVIKSAQRTSFTCLFFAPKLAYG